ncbi:nuclease-related domain-containing protein [Psychrobacillus sp. NPDC058041]|uniref:nuclease-related domain-containing protein n=1 Tax=Psychrobacillus sp. NPDC058041 TaxID=3346310 RepID=UPI0036DAFE1A
MLKMKKRHLIAVGSIVLFVLLTWIPILLPILIIAAMILVKVKYPTIKGAVGEWKVNKLLSNLGSNYSIYHDLYVPNGAGGTTQVDHVVTSPFGIFVIETKHYEGWIFGDEKQRYWTQVIYKRKEKLFNPIWQNYGHIQAIKNQIPIENFEFIYSIIAFSKQSTFKFKNEFKSARVIQFPQLLEVIQEKNLHRISSIELQKINRGLEKLLIKDEKEKKQVKKQHVQAIKKNRKEKVETEKKNIIKISVQNVVEN